MPSKNDSNLSVLNNILKRKSKNDSEISVFQLYLYITYSSDYMKKYSSKNVAIPATEGSKDTIVLFKGLQCSSDKNYDFFNTYPLRGEIQVSRANRQSSVLWTFNRMSNAEINENITCLVSI